MSSTATTAAVAVALVMNEIHDFFSVRSFRIYSKLTFSNLPQRAQRSWSPRCDKCTLLLFHFTFISCAKYLVYTSAHGKKIKKKRNHSHSSSSPASSSWFLYDRTRDCAFITYFLVRYSHFANSLFEDKYCRDERNGTGHRARTHIVAREQKRRT